MNHYIYFNRCQYTHQLILSAQTPHSCNQLARYVTSCYKMNALCLIFLQFGSLESTSSTACSPYACSSDGSSCGVSCVNDSMCVDSAYYCCMYSICSLLPITKIEFGIDYLPTRCSDGRKLYFQKGAGNAMFGWPRMFE